MFEIDEVDAALFHYYDGIESWFEHNGNLYGVVTIDVTPSNYSVDLDIDSDNDDGFADPERSEAEDRIEDTGNHADLPGKVIFANTANVDGDDVPDFADGFNANQGTDASSAFIPVIVQFTGQPLDREIAQVKFTYDASNPAGVTATPDASGKYVYTPAPGHLRLWTKDGPESRNAAELSSGGDYIPSERLYKLSQLPAINEIAPGIWRLYVEAIDVSQETADQRILATFRPEGTVPDMPEVEDAVRTTLIDWRVVEVREDGTLQPTDEIVISETAPVVTITSYSITNLRLSADLTQILGDIAIAGTIDCAVCDYTPGALGQINEVFVYLNGAFTTLGSITTVVSKAPGLDSLLKPYDFDASFSRLLVGVELRPGFNNLQVTASERVYDTVGSAEWAVEVLAEAPYSSEIVELEATFATSPTPSAPDQVLIAVQKNGVPTTATLFETGYDTMFFESSDGSIALDLRSAPPLDPAAVDSLAALFWDSNSGIEGLEIPIDESHVNSLAFSGFTNREVEAHEFADYGGFTLGVGQTKPVIQTGAGMLRAYLAEMRGPDEFLERIEHVQTDDGPRKVVKAGDDYFLGMKETSAGGAAPVAPGDKLRPAVLSARVSKILQEAYVNPRTSLDYNIGVLEGFFRNGLVGMLEGTWGLIKLGAEINNYYSPAEIYLRWRNGEVFAKEKQFVGIASDAIETMADIARAIQQFNQTTIEAVMTGNLAQLEELGQTMTLVVEISVDVLLDFAERLAGLSEREKGRVVGQLYFEALTFIGPAAATKVSKLGFLNHVRQAAVAGRFGELASPAIRAAFDAGGRLFKLVDLLSDATNKMCFVAGTKVHTDRGLKNIEEVAVGDRVLARDEQTGEEAYKPVTETFVTHPSRLFTVLCRVEGTPPSGESKLVCTGEHPFYVVNRNEFVPAERLAKGDRLLLANGGEASITAILYENAPRGQTFTTYNLAVKDFHTYFAGEDGVWVHNTGSWCDHYKGFWLWLRQSRGETPEEAVRLTEKLIDSGLRKNRFSKLDYHEAVQSMAKLAAHEIGQSVGDLPSVRELRRGLPFPTGVSNNREFGDLMKWSVFDDTSAGALKAMNDIDAAYLQSNGVTLDIAKRWRDFYIAITRDPIQRDKNPSAAGRAVLMHHAYKLLGGN